MIKTNVTFCERYGPAMDMKTQSEADEYFEALVLHNMQNSSHTKAEAIEIEKGNLGYFAGYYSNEVRQRVEKLFRCHHPIFGAIAHRKQPTSDECLKMGMEMGEHVKNGGKIKMLKQPK